MNERIGRVRRASARGQARVARALRKRPRIGALFDAAKQIARSIRNGPGRTSRVKLEKIRKGEGP